MIQSKNLIQKVKKNLFIHRHGANFVKSSNKLNKNHVYSSTGTPIILPSYPGGDTMLLKPLKNIDEFLSSMSWHWKKN